MLRRIDLRGRTPGTIELRGLLPRAPIDVESALAAVRPLCDDVKNRGALAVRDITRRFDGVDLETLRVPARALADALERLDPAVRVALVEAARRARLVHEAQLRDDVDVVVASGGRVGERWLPVRRVGLYVPGGLVAYPSSVVMNVVPAQVAGVRSLALASPPQKEFGGLPHPAVLAACALLGVDEVYAVGGAQAIAMFAYGSTAAGGEEIEPVDVVTGPGNIYVAAAKRVVKGVVGIDSEAGPTEIAILADDSADPAYLAADLIAQAEHDELASCLLVTESAELVDAVDAELRRQVPATKHVERVQAALVGQSGYVLVDDVDAGLAVVDAWAAEHLEVITRDARKVAERVHNAGAIFVGPWSPVSLGDYLAGSNHVLPTGGTARFTGGLSVQAFQRMIHLIEYDRGALAEVAPLIDALGGAEDLAAHVAAVRIRIPKTAESR
ncbi:MAG: histidinol dehydrogenase [Actinomycetota bacterium]|nr:histidinol dehydrogenase [Actinomycetota bacterium]